MKCQTSLNINSKISFTVQPLQNYSLTQSAVQIASNVIPSAGNFNSVIQTGVYKFLPTPANSPLSTYGVLNVYAAENYISQIVQSMNDAATDGLFTRYSVDSGATWSNWVGRFAKSVYNVEVPEADGYRIVSSVDILPHSMVKLSIGLQRFSTTSANPTGLIITSATSRADITALNTLCKAEQDPNTQLVLNAECTYLNADNTTKTFYIYARLTAADHANLQVIQENYGHR